MGYPHKDATEQVLKFIREAVDWDGSAPGWYRYATVHQNVMDGKNVLEDLAWKPHWLREGCYIDVLATGVLVAHRRWNVDEVSVYRLRLSPIRQCEVGYMEAQPATEEQDWYGIGYVNVKSVTTWAIDEGDHQGAHHAKH